MQEGSISHQHPPSPVCTLIFQLTGPSASNSALTCHPVHFLDHNVLISTTNPSLLNALNYILCPLHPCPTKSCQSHPGMVTSSLHLL